MPYQVDQMQEHAIREMFVQSAHNPPAGMMPMAAAAHPDAMDMMEVSVHGVPTHRFISSCVSY